MISRLIKTLFISTVALTSISSAIAKCNVPNCAVDEQKTIDRIHQTFPKLKIDSVKPSELPGVVEVYAGGKIIYYAIDQHILIFGELYNAEGKPITEEKMAIYSLEQIRQLDRKKAVTYGHGSNEVIAFVNPFCGYCKKAYEWFKTQPEDNNIVQRIFFIPTPGSSEAHQRAIEVICTPEDKREEALVNAFSQSHVVSELGKAGCEGAEETLAEHVRIAQALGVTATPYFVVNGQSAIEGFVVPKIKEALKPTPSGG